MFEFLKELANDNDWQFVYGRDDYQNLTELETNQLGLFVDPITFDSKFSDYGEEYQKSYSVSMMLLVNSDVDEDYQFKYDNHIQPLIESQLVTIKEAFACSNFSITSWRTIELINYLDNNYDGLIITFSADDDN
jgi:hypothetical protein